MNTSTQIDYLESAGTMLDKLELRDSSTPGLLDVTGISQHGMATASGLNDYEYQNLSSFTCGQKELKQIASVNKVPVPPEILEHFKHIKCHCMMGLFPEIGRAWLTIDSEIYIWTYEYTRDMAFFDGLTSVIVSVGLITPRPKVFIPEIKHLLILTTPTNIVVLGVSFNKITKVVSALGSASQQTIYDEMELISKPVFILTTENVAINVIESCSNGRIFLGGRDGCLYELHYQAESTWFGKKCKKINHSQGLISYMVPNFMKVFSEADPIIKISIDNSRQLLYVLTEHSAIEVWDMGADYTTMRRITRLSQNDISSNASNIIKTVDSSNFKPIKSLCPLTIEDCHGLNLIAVTQTGFRLYFGTTPLHMNLTDQHRQAVPNTFVAKPQGLYLLHVRLPPGYTPNSTINRPRAVHAAKYCEGSFLLVCSPHQDQDFLWSISSTPYPNRPYLAESTAVLPLDGVVWSICETTNKNVETSLSTYKATQQPKNIVLLTNQGVHIFSLLKAVDVLRQLLTTCNGPHHEAIKAYFQTQSEREACASCLLLACSDIYRGTTIAEWAVQAFMLYGGEPSTQGSAAGMVNQPSSPGGRPRDRSPTQMFVSTPLSGRNVSNIQQNLRQHIQFPTMSPIPGQNFPHMFSDMSAIIFSAKHDGLYLYVVRLLRPIWKKRCVDGNLYSTITRQDCIVMLEELHALKSFLNANSVNDISGSGRLQVTNSNFMPSGFGNLMTSTSGLPDQRTSDEQAQSEEKRSLKALNYLIKHFCEVLALWKTLCEHQLHVLALQLPKDEQTALSLCTFRDLTLSRADLCAHLIVLLISIYLNDGANVSSICSKMREDCPNLFKHEDAVAFKATEILISSKSSTNAEEKEQKLKTALQLCKDAAPYIPLSNICQQFIQAEYYEGLINLVATCAAKVDSEGIALHYFKNNEPADDGEGYAAFATRMNMYKEVRQMLDVVYQNLCNIKDIPESSIAPFGFNEKAKNPKTEILKIISAALRMNDELLQMVIYEWMLSHEMSSELLLVTEPSLGDFLKKSVLRNPENFNLTDLLWKYYEKNGQHSAAAHILDKLASMPSSSIPLGQRIEYLVRAVMCLRNDSLKNAPEKTQILRELEDKLEIARVQQVVLNAVSAIRTAEAMEAERNLNCCLYDITQLYSDFAEPFELWQCKLTILKCSRHNDPLLIEEVWMHILNDAVNGPESPREKCTRLLTTVQTLVQEYKNSGHCFPLAFLVRELEVKCCQLKVAHGTIPEALLQMDIDVDLLIDYYSRLVSMNERIWANEGDEWHLVHSSARLVDLFVSNIQNIPIRNKRRVIAKAEDLLSSCLHLLYPKPGTDDLMRKLREIQNKIQKI